MSKMRITLLKEVKRGTTIISDRLVDQVIEFRNGPKENHSGPMRVEFNLDTKDDADKAANYLKQLIGVLPLQSKNMKLVKIKKGTVIEDSKEPLEELMKSALGKNKTQEELITFLREHGFKFIESDVITEVSKDLQERIKLKEIHKKYQFMIRLVKPAKTPMNDKYDSRLLFGIKLWGSRVDKVIVYLFGEFKTKKNIPWKDKKKLNFKKVEKLMVFPEFMDYDDRKKWRNEFRKKQNCEANGTDFTPSKFFTKHEPFVQFILSDSKKPKS